MSTDPTYTGRAWRRRLVLFALLALLVGVAMVFLGTSVAPCLGGWLTSGDNPCVEAWEARKNIVERIHDAFGPWSFSIGVFAILVLAAAARDRIRARR